MTIKIRLKTVEQGAVAELTGRDPDRQSYIMGRAVADSITHELRQQRISDHRNGLATAYEVTRRYRLGKGIDIYA